MDSEFFQKLEEHLLTIKHNQIKYQLEIDAQLAEFEQNRERSPTPQPIMNNPPQFHHHGNNQPFRNEQDPDERIMWNIKIDAPSFDSTIKPQLFLDWMKENGPLFQMVHDVRRAKSQFCCHEVDWASKSILG